MRRLIDKLRDQRRVRFGTTQAYDDFDIPGSAQVVVADNVCDYFYVASDQENWLIDRDFPNLAPPWERFWIEFRSPPLINSAETGGRPWEVHEPRMYGTYFEAVDYGEDREAREAGVRWAVSCQHYVEGGAVGGRPPGELLRIPWVTVYGVAADGTMARDPASPTDMSLKFVPMGVDPARWEQWREDMDLLQSQATPLLYVPFLTLSFLHCKNVEVVDDTMPEKLARKHRKRGRSVSSFHVLKIDPMVRRVQRVEGEQGVGTAQALHIMRGHFKDYTQRGLFGQHKGMFWWEQQVRGAADAVADKRYEVKAPDE